MTTFLNTASSDFDADFNNFLDAKRASEQDVGAVAQEIIDKVRAEGDKALIDYSAKFDQLELASENLRIHQSEIDAAYDKTDQQTRDALQLAHDRIKSHHEKQVPQDSRYQDAIGVELGAQWRAIEAVGLYVPGGTASYPSSVLMNAVPAKVAGVPRIAMVVPTPNGALNPLVLVAAHMAGVDEIYRIGGAQAVAALAYGTQTIPAVAKIVGPGNAYVAAAKRLVFGTVGIDMIAGPSEILVIADENNDPHWIAADLLAQAEHDMAAQSILITDNADFGQKVNKAVEEQLAELPRQNIAATSWRDHGAIITIDKISSAIPLIDRIAPEHLELAIDQADDMAKEVRNAGAIFIGRHTPEVIGDYVGGSNHVLPTARSARFSSGLGVLDFMKRSSILKLTEDNLEKIGPAAMTLAQAEGLEAHSRSVGVRFGRRPWDNT